MSPTRRLQDELKQTRPWSRPSEEAAVALMRTADLINRSISGILEPVGITGQQYNVLRILRGAGEKGLPTLDIAERMIEQTPGITRLIDRLEVKALVSRKRCETDRRQVFCIITKKGLELIDKLGGPLRVAEEEALGMLGKKGLEQLIDLLARTREGIEASLLARRKR
jgi:DNA-binding MarR family transcriptional regulator